MRPGIGVLTKVDRDHVKTFRTVSEVEAFFVQFLAQSKVGLAPEGFGLGQFLRHVSVHTDTGVSIDRSGSVFDWRGQRVRVPLLGAHNAANAAALEACGAGNVSWHAQTLPVCGADAFGSRRLSRLRPPVAGG